MMMLMTKMMLVMVMMMTRPMMMMHLQKRTGFNDNDDDGDDADDEDDADDDAPAEKRPGCVQLDEVDIGPTLAVHFLHTIICNFPSFSLIFALSLSILFCVNHLCKIQFFF